MAAELKYYDLETASGTVQVQLTDKDAEARGYSVKDGRPGPKPAKRPAAKSSAAANKAATAANKDADTGGVGTTSTADAGTPPAATK
ncbi:hypothetical protein [Nocardia phage KYD2]|nr:hypothetical protein [Nocardia phage KYD2]